MDMCCEFKSCPGCKYFVQSSEHTRIYSEFISWSSCKLQVVISRRVSSCEWHSSSMRELSKPWICYAGSNPACLSLTSFVFGYEHITDCGADSSTVHYITNAPIFKSLILCLHMNGPLDSKIWIYAIGSSGAWSPILLASLLRTERNVL